jgi:hypothetical protein
MSIAAGVITPAAAVAESAGGNNGTVKVDGGTLDNGNANEPHVGCDFAIEWFGFDSDASSSVTFTMQPPTNIPNAPGASTSVAFGPFDLGSNGASNQSFNIYDLLKNFTAQPNQGLHVKLETHTTWSNGDDTKYKAYWVTGCGAELGSVTLDKVVAGPAPAGDPGYTFNVVADDPDATVVSPVTVKASDPAVPVATNVPLGTKVTITETRSQGASSTSYSVDGGAAQLGSSVEVTVASSSAVAVVAANTFTPPPVELGSVTLDKVVAGPAPAGDPEYTFTVVADDPDASVRSPVTIKASDPAVPVATNVPVGTKVTITETGSQGASSTSYAVDGGLPQQGTSVDVTVQSTAAVAVVATNRFTSVLGETVQPPETTEVLTQPTNSPTALGQPLARTGADHGLLVAFGAALIGAGVILSAIDRRLRTAR